MHDIEDEDVPINSLDRQVASGCFRAALYELDEKFFNNHVLHATRILRTFQRMAPLLIAHHFGKDVFIRLRIQVDL